jgi:hypothetical protein
VPSVGALVDDADQGRARGGEQFGGSNRARRALPHLPIFDDLEDKWKLGLPT